MSSTLTWLDSPNGSTITTTASSVFNNLKTLITTTSAGANYQWQIASSIITGASYQIVLKRKDGSAGRILIWNYVTPPATFNPTLFETAPTVDTAYITYFPNGNTDTASAALTAATGTIMGDDTNALKASADLALSNLYSSNIVPYYYESDAGMIFVFQSPSSTQTFALAAGDLIVDGTDTAYSCNMSTGYNSLSTLGANGCWNWSPLSSNDSYPVGSNTTQPCWTVNYNGSSKRYFQAWIPSGQFAANVGTNDLLLDDTNGKAYFFPIQLIGQVRGEGLALKLRQIAFGPGQIAPKAIFNTTGPTVAARAINNHTTGASGVPWLVNFKL